MQSKILKFLLLSAFLLLGGCAYYNTLFNAKQSYNDGLKTIRENPDQANVPPAAKKHFETTIEKCWKLIDIYSDQSKYADDALLYIAKSEFYVEKYAQARVHLEQFMGKYGESDLIPEAQLWYGKVLLKENEVETANEYFLRVINNARKSKIRSEAYFELGLYAFEQKDYTQAIEYLEQALKEKIDDEFKAFLLYNLGEAYFIQGKYKEAIDQYKRVDKFSPAIDIEYKSKLHLAQSYTALKKYEDAYQLLRKALTAPRFNAFSPVLKTAMGENYEAQQRYVDAVDTYREIIQERKPSPGTAQAAFNLAELFEFYYQDIDSAVAYYGKVAKLYSQFDSVEVANNKKLFLSEFKDIRDGIRHDERMVYRLSNEPGFRDSLYQAQYLDSLRIASGEVDTTGSHSPADSLRPLSREDSLALARQNPLFNPDDSATDTTGGLENPNRPPDEGQEYTGLRGDATQPNPVSGRNNPSNPGRSGNASQNSGEEKKKKTLEKRKLPQIEFDLMNNRYHLAEFYLLKVEKYDSAAHHFNHFLETYEDSILTPKALYSLIYIYKLPQHQDLPRVYELEKRILKDYAYSPFAREIMKNKGMLDEDHVEETPESKARDKFREAEKLYFEGKYRSAIPQYRQVANADTTWDVSAQAQFVIAWIYEHNLANIDSAMAAYKRVIDRYPAARQYVAVARKKVSPPPPEAPVASDSTLAAGAAQDTAAASTPDQLSDPSKLGSEDILKDKIRWRNNRSFIK
ncbi:MAG: tetratricopeptide repeat protein [Calditrichaeota bacterium]|nr:tetratricopeptide repeat protein [Calditrichota bacterium]MCB0294604.1 tetratricopeptide repeat protein [Calditrichota bacterium]MCB0311650.1 tetratricopeptide repeat protein [Calditrichota bacterium]